MEVIAGKDLLCNQWIELRVVRSGPSGVRVEATEATRETWIGDIIGRPMRNIPKGERLSFSREPCPWANVILGHPIEHDFS